MNTAMNAKTLEFVKASGEALEASQKMAENVQAEHAKVAKMLPSRIDSLIQHELISKDERAFAQEKLASHAGAIEVLGNVLGWYDEKKAELQKQATDLTKQAGVQGQGAPEVGKKASTHEPFRAVGARVGSGEKPESYQRFEDALLGK